jgi:4,5-dihydroxyphthalate decarboxylase
MAEPRSFSASDPRPALCAAIGTYPHTRPLKTGAIVSDILSLDFADIVPINRAFAPMAREQRFDVSEMAIATVFQALAFGKPLVLLPVTLAARFQEPALLCRTDGPIAGPTDLAGRRVGVRAYSQTTGLWLRGILADEHGVKPEDIRWVTFEGAHVAEYQDPSFVERAPPGREMLAMLREGDLDAVIVGNDMLDDSLLRTVFPDPSAASRAFAGKHGFVPINHVVVVRRDIAEARPDLAVELVRLFEAARAADGSAEGDFDIRPIGRAALQPSLALGLDYAQAQGLLPRRLSLDELWDGLPQAVA